ncbi:MAG: hypothetical protein E4H13_02960 [Calditrichales bacterium]|nr:MAG: hypothetical protein E4H13_02960 [Calditrichales bacterium]
MMRYEYYLPLILIIFTASCSNSPQSSLPLINLYEKTNQIVVIEGQPENFLVLNSHRQNTLPSEGWFVRSVHLLQDYQVYLNAKTLSRDSLNQCELSPGSFTRRYYNGVEEKVFVPDSLDAVIWTFSGTQINDELQFEPRLPGFETQQQKRLSSGNRRLVFALSDSDSVNILDNNAHLGFLYREESDDAVIIIAARQNDLPSLNRMLDFLAENYLTVIEKKRDKLAALLELNQTFTNVPEITDALSWAQISLDAQISASPFPVIRSGLGDFKFFPCRDVFKALPGALLVSGQFAQARSILETFGEQQYPTDDDKFPGQIPDLETGTKPAGASADGSWWYIRAAYEYICYSGDIQFIQTVFPVIQRALEGTIRRQMDKNFYFIPGSDAALEKIRTGGAERFHKGDRIVELQALWYTALHIGANLAEWSERPELADYWRAIAATLKENLYRDFWNSFSYKLYDHIKTDGRIDKDLHPEQVFVVTAPDLPGIQPVLSEDIRARITSSVLSQLAFYDGIRPGAYNKSSANQTNVPSPTTNELGNPLISALFDAAQEQPAYTLYYNEALQILFDSPLGGWTEFHTRVKKDALILKGKLNHAVSLAGFLANFYQNFTGYKPNLLAKEIYLRPLFPEELKFIATRLPHPDGGIQFTYTADENLIQVELTRLTEYVNCQIILQIPGYEAVEIALNDDTPTSRLTFLLSNRRAYQKYPTLDWYFTQPEDSIPF